MVYYSGNNIYYYSYRFWPFGGVLGTILDSVLYSHFSEFHYAFIIERSNMSSLSLAWNTTLVC